MSGFIAIHREAFDHPLLRDGERFRAWFWMVSRAVWKPTNFDVRGKVVTLERGQFCTSRDQMAKELGWSPSAVERFLTRLETEQMIGRETGQGKTIITICNYAKYQDVTDEPGQQTGQQTGQKSDRNRTAKEQGNQGTIVEEEDKSSPSTARERASDPFPRPDWCSPQVWRDLKANRKTKRLPNTATAHAKLIRDLEALADDEWPPGRLLEAIVARGWAAVYDPREGRRSDRPNQPHSHQRETTRETGERVAARLAASANR